MRATIATGVWWSASGNAVFEAASIG